MEDLRQRLKIPAARLEEINTLMLDPSNRLIQNLLDVVKRYGTPESINQQANEAGKLENLLKLVAASRPDHLNDLKWLEQQRDSGAFINLEKYRSSLNGGKGAPRPYETDKAVTMEISACQYFPWVMAAARRAIERQNLMPGRFIKVRNMKEQEADGDLPAFAAAMQIIGASYVETLDTRGTDGSNVHLGGPETITGYFGGVGEPNEYPLKWLDEFLYYYTKYGVRQVLNVNPGTVLLAYMLQRLGVDIEFKISVYMGNDNPYAALWTLLGAKLFQRRDGTTPLVGFNWSNSANNETLELTADIRHALGFEDHVRFEHHITETWKSIVRQPYNKRQELIELADHVANISAKHEGGEIDIDSRRSHPSDILDYFRARADIESAGDWEALTLNFLDKFDSVNLTARALLEHGIPVMVAGHLHGSLEGVPT
jgi:hypothetical protein